LQGTADWNENIKRGMQTLFYEFFSLAENGNRKAGDELCKNSNYME
jgi:hypothetical protein